MSIHLLNEVTIWSNCAEPPNTKLQEKKYKDCRILLIRIFFYSLCSQKKKFWWIKRYFSPGCCSSITLLDKPKGLGDGTTIWFATGLRILSERVQQGHLQYTQPIQLVRKEQNTSQEQAGKHIICFQHVSRCGGTENFGRISRRWSHRKVKHHHQITSEMHQLTRKST